MKKFIKTNMGTFVTTSDMFSKGLDFGEDLSLVEGKPSAQWRANLAAPILTIAPKEECTKALG